MKWTFDLAHEPWIPCVDQSGRVRSLGLMEVLATATDLAEIRDDSPVVTASLHFLALGVLHRVLGGPKNRKEWTGIWDRGRFDQGLLEAYFRTWPDRFDLFHPTFPFFQAAGFEKIDSKGKGAPSQVARLALELASGNNPTLFDHTREAELLFVKPAVAARWLVANQLFSVGGGKSGSSRQFGEHPNFTHAPMVGGLACFLTGRNLFETLALNLVFYDGSPGSGKPFPVPERDMPAWERDEPRLPVATRIPDGLLDLLTWQTRHVRLIPEADPSGELSVAWMHYGHAGGVPWAATEGLRNPYWAYRIHDGEIRSVGVSAERAAWRDSDAMFMSAATAGPDLRPIAMMQVGDLVERGDVEIPRFGCAAIGLVNDRAKVETWRLDRFEVPAGLAADAGLAQALTNGLGLAENVAKDLGSSFFIVSKHLSGAAGELRDVAVRAYWNGLVRYFRTWIFDLPRDDQSAPAWFASVRREALAAHDAVGRTSLKNSGRGLQALAESRRFLAGRLRKLEESWIVGDEGGHA